MLAHTNIPRFVWREVNTKYYKYYCSTYYYLYSTNTNKFFDVNANNNTIQYNNNGKPNPDNAVLYLYTTYDSNSFRPISIISCPIILLRSRGLCTGDSFQLLVVVKLQIFDPPRIFLKSQ